VHPLIETVNFRAVLNLSMGTLKLQSNGPSLYSNTVTGTLAVDGWIVTKPCAATVDYVPKDL